MIDETEARPAESEDAMLAADDVSFGVYPFPLSAVEVGPAPVDTTVTVGRTVRPVKLTVERCDVPPTSMPGTRDVRIIPSGTGDVLSWIQCPPNSAFGWFVQALPRYWLNRHRLTRSEKAVLAAGGTIDLALGSPRRNRHREELGHHANSLKCKLWAIRYHRDNLRAAIADCQRRPVERNFHLIRANAEFTAHDNECYALLDEIARVLALLQTMRSGSGTPESFHDLHTKRAGQDAALARVLENTGWYEGFRMRRANSTHAFKAFASYSSDEGEVRLWQHPDRKIFPAPELSVGGTSAERVLDELSTSFDNFLSDLSVYLLTLFHDFDVVSMHLKETLAESPEQVTVWTKRVFFTRELPPGTDILIDPEGGVEVRYEGRSITMGVPSNTTGDATSG